MRKMAVIKRIDEIKAIPDADKICVYRLDGWWVVDLVEKYSVGDLVIYCEIDSWIPHSVAPFLSKAHAPRVFEGIPGERLRTVKLRGQVSQGLLLPLSIVPGNYTDADIDTDVSEKLGILKYEVPIPSELAGQVHGNFPTFIKKTDQERCQNLGRDIFDLNADSRYEVSMKLDGTSFTAFYVDGEEGVCGRNWELEINDANKDNSLIRMFIDSGMQTALRADKSNIAIQAELMGPGIQKNREGFKSTQLFVFDIYDIDNGCYLPPADRELVLDSLYEHGLNMHYVSHVPIFHKSVTLSELGINNIKDLLLDADGPSIVNTVREGKVYKRVDGKFSFKAISDKFLLKEKDD